MPPSGITLSPRSFAVIQRQDKIAYLLGIMSAAVRFGLPAPAETVGIRVGRFVGSGATVEAVHVGVQTDKTWQKDIQDVRWCRVVFAG